MTDPVDLDMLNELKMVMEDQFNMLVETFLSDSEVRVQEIADAIAAGDADALRRAAHSMKGSCSNLGVAPLSQICYEAETIGREGGTDGAAEVLERIRTEFARVQDVMNGILAG